MELLSKLFEPLVDAVGRPAVMLAAAAFVVLAFGQGAAKLFSDTSLFSLLAVALFVLCVWMGLMHVLSSFDVKSGRGTIEGLMAGVIAGVFGGAVYTACQAETEWLQPFSRALLTTMCLGAVHGATLSLSGPSERFARFQRLKILVTFGTAIVLFAGIAVGYIGETLMPGRYVTFREVATTMAVFIVVKAFIALVRDGRRWASFVGRLATICALAGLIGGAAWSIAPSIDAVTIVHHGWEFECVSTGHNSLLRFRNPGSVPGAVLALMVLVVCASSAYFLATSGASAGAEDSGGATVGRADGGRMT